MGYDEAFAAYRAGDSGGAAQLLDRLLAEWPEDARCYLLKAVVADEGDSAIGLSLAELAAVLAPADAEAWYNLGAFEGQRGGHEAALDAYLRAVALDPLHLQALGNGCELLRRAGRFEEALEWADRHLAYEPDNWAAHLNRAVSLMHLRRFRDAEPAFARAIALAPDRPIVRWERHGMLLFQRRFAEAWDDYEARFAAGYLNGVFAYPFAQPPWTGQPLAGRHLLVHNEQGLGDQIMFASALPEAVAAAGRVTLVAAPELAPLFAASFPRARVLPARPGAGPGDHPAPDWLGELDDVDFQVPIGSLMAVLRRTPDSFADPRPYLRPSDAARARWADFDAGPGLAVGLCWASNPALFRHDSARRAVAKSMALETMASLAGVPGVSPVSVLNWPAPADWLRDVSPQLGSLDDTAALIDQLDLVVTVDTSVAHLAGALGKETWLLLHDFADSRWGLEDDRSYWYPDVRLFRQQAPGDWAPVVAQVAAELAHRAGAHR